jgi:hypothetical protein
MEIIKFTEEDKIKEFDALNKSKLVVADKHIIYFNDTVEFFNYLKSLEKPTKKTKVKVDLEKGKIVAIGDNIDYEENIFDVSEDLLILNEDGTFDYSAIFKLNVEVVNNEVKIKNDLDN